jgi:hypothetical protein
MDNHIMSYMAKSAARHKASTMGKELLDPLLQTEVDSHDDSGEFL